MSRADFLVGPFAVRLILVGERYGLDACITHGSTSPSERHEPLVEFWDVSQDPERFPRGQFVSRYYLSTLLATRPDAGLMLHGSEPSWTVSAIGMARVRDYLRGVDAALTPSNGA